MKHSDELVDKVIAGLRDAEPATGMEGRILEAVERRALERSEAGWWQRYSNVFRPSPAKLLLCGSALVIVVSLVMNPKIYQHGGLSPLSAGFPAPNAAAVIRTSPIASATSEQSLRRATSAKKQNSQVPHVLEAKSVHVVNTDADSLALREMTAASHPAPPLPLTAQEKLLLRVVHKGDPVELAMLNPEVRARQIADSQAEFQKFFVPDRSGEAQ